MSWAYLASEIEAAAVTTLAADSDVAALSVVTIEAEPPQAGNGAPEVTSAQMPYVGVRSGDVSVTVIGSRTLQLEHELMLRVLVEMNTTAEAFVLARSIADTCAKAVRAMNGSSSWLASGNQVLCDKWTTTRPEVSAESPYFVECRAAVPVAVIYTEV